MDAATTVIEPGILKPRDPGLYLGLDEQAYHDDLALGSSDMRKLRRNPTTYWYESAMNPNRPKDKNTPARIRGRALHKLVLEGSEKFDALFMRGPDQEEDATPAEKAAVTKEAKKRAAARGLVLLPAEDYDRVVISSAMISQNPELAPVFKNGISEVSVFWERDGVRRKARFDYLKQASPLQGGVGDLKGIANPYDIDFEAACYNDIARYRYDMQSAHYLEARYFLPKLIADGAVFGDCDPSLLKRIAESKRFAFQFVFFQMEGAPVTDSFILSATSTDDGAYLNGILEIGRRDLETAADSYKAYLEKFGTSMWLRVERPREADIGSMPAFYGKR
jgi:hypothetical protein